MTDAEAIRALIAEWHRATAAGDVDAVARLMVDDAMFLVAGRPPMNGREEFVRGLRGLLATHRIESTGDVQEVVVSGDLAYARSMLHVRVMPNEGGAPQVRSGPVLSVFHRQPDGSWLLARDANLLA